MPLKELPLSQAVARHSIELHERQSQRDSYFTRLSLCRQENHQDASSRQQRKSRL